MALWLGCGLLMGVSALPLSAQTAPAARSVPFSETFGTTSFAALPAGFAAWSGLNGGSVSDATKAAASVPTADAAVTAATTPQTAGGFFGYASSGDARPYIQTSSNSTNGACQLAMALDTRGFTDLTVAYDLAIVSAQPRSIGVVCQYRLGTSGGWTNLAASTGTNPFTHPGGTPTEAQTVHVALPNAAADQPVVQVRWAVWRGAESGNSSGISIDNITATGTAVASSLQIAASPTVIAENGGTATVTVTTSAPVEADLPVTLTVSDPTEAAVEGSNPVVIPAGSTQAVFTVRGVDDLALDGVQSVTLEASAPAAAAVSITISVTDDEDAWSPPESHYAAAAGLTGQALKAALHTIASTGHRQYAYSNTFNPIRAINADPADTNFVLTVYSGTSVPKNDVYRPDAGLDPGLTWSREHLWPVSYGLDPDGVDPGVTDGDAGPDYTDLFNLRPAINTVNGQRSNRYFDETSGTPSIPPLAPLCTYDTNSWEPRDEEKGDIARAMFYMAVRYDGGEPLTMDLELGNSPSSAAGRFGHLATLLRWHTEDPVSLTERQRNHLIFTTYQKNRNPFVDHPEFAAMLWGSVGVAPTSLSVAEGGASATYSVVLTSQPSADVTVASVASASGVVSLSPASVVFTAANWNVPQTITVTAVDDAVHEPAASVTITHQIASADSYFASLEPPSVSVAVADNDPLIAPLPLPLAYGGPWSPLPAQGFLATGVGTYSTSLGGDTGTGSAKFDSTGDRLTIAFSGTPGTVSYQLKGNPASGTATAGLFEVLESADGENFTQVRSHVDKSNTTEGFTGSLLATTRFVTFVYTTKTAGNIQMDQLSITAAATATPWESWLASFGLTDASMAGDADSDGLPNLAEYALGESPSTATPNGTAMTSSRGADFTRITAVLRGSDPSLTVVAETTANLTDTGSWTTAGISATAAADQSGVPEGFVRMVFEVPDGTATARFVRLRFTLVE